MVAKKNPNWGGARPNSGPKKQSLSYNQIKEMLSKADEYAKKHGKTIDEVLLDFVYQVDDEVTKKDQLAAIKLWKDKTHIEIKEGGDTDKELGPGLFIPEQDPDPVLKAVGE